MRDIKCCLYQIPYCYIPRVGCKNSQKNARRHRKPPFILEGFYIGVVEIYAFIVNIVPIFTEQEELILSYFILLNTTLQNDEKIQTNTLKPTKKKR
jgi:hypothetical protein